MAPLRLCSKRPQADSAAQSPEAIMYLNPAYF